MVKFLSILLLFSLLFSAEKEAVIEITADKFEIDQNTHITKFIGHVHITQDKDWIKGDIVKVFGDANDKIERYEAHGNVRFETMNEDSHYKGLSDDLEYYPKIKKYILTHNVIVDELKSDKKLQGDKVILDRITNKHEVFGGKKPVKFRFDSSK